MGSARGSTVGSDVAVGKGVASGKGFTAGSAGAASGVGGSDKVVGVGSCVAVDSGVASGNWGGKAIGSASPLSVQAVIKTNRPEVTRSTVAKRV